MPSALWTNVKRIGGCPVCHGADWCTYKDDESTGDRLYCCMRDHESEEFPVLGERGKEDANGNRHTIYIGSPSDAERAHSRREPTGAAYSGRDWARELPSVIGTPSGGALPSVIKGARVFYFQDEHGNPTHAEIHKSAIYHWNGSAWVIGRGDRKKPLYRLPHVLEAVAAGEDVWITEGYKDADTLCSHGLCATSGGSSTTWLPEYTASLRGAKRVILCGDMDDAGQKHLEKLKRTLKFAVGELLVISAFPGFEQKKEHGADVTDYLEANPGTTLEDLRALAEPAEKKVQPACSYNELLQMEFRDDWIIEGILAPGTINGVLGHPGAGKSMLMLDLAVALAYKDKWTGHYPIKRNCNVLIYSKEGGLRLLNRRARQRPREESPTTGKQVFCWKGDQIGDDGVLTLSHNKIEEIVDTIHELGAEVVIFDPMVEFHGGDENNQQEMAEIVAVLRAVVDYTKACVIITHHPRKGNGDSKPGSLDNWRGSSVLVGAMDTVLELEDRNGDRFLHFSKVRDGPKPEAVMLEMGDDLVFRYQRNATEAEKRARNQGRNEKISDDQLCDLVSRRGWVTAKELGEEQEISEQTFKRRMEALCCSGRLIKRERVVEGSKGRPMEYHIPSTEEDLTSVVHHHHHTFKGRV